MDTSHDISVTSMSHNRSSTAEEEEDLRRQMTGIFGLIDKNNTGYISISQLEETIRELGGEAQNNGDFMEFIQSFGAYMETINALGNETVDVNKMDLDAFCKCTKNYMVWRRVRQLKRQDSNSFYLVCFFLLFTFTLFILSNIHSTYSTFQRVICAYVNCIFSFKYVRIWY
jgi:hypothetical protein